MFLTKSQRAARETLVQMGQLFFSGERILPAIKVRLFPVLIGPTGVGKNFLVESAATQLDAYYVKRARGDWLPMGSKSGRPTVFQILDYVATYDRVLLQIDELDKFTDLQNGEWSASIASDLWAVLDLSFQIPEFLREVTFPGREPPTVAEMHKRIHRNLWIVGSGTFQKVFESGRANASIGFGRDQHAHSVGMDEIVASRSISLELLVRFNGNPIIIQYPSAEETLELLRSSGIAGLARRLGMQVGPEDIDWTRGGMRALESLATQLMLAHHRRKSRLQQEPQSQAFVTKAPESAESAWF
jgi:hypothetical protein